MAILHTFASLHLCTLPRDIFEKAGKLAAQQHMGPSEANARVATALVSSTTAKLSYCQEAQMWIAAEANSIPKHADALERVAHFDH